MKTYIPTKVELKEMGFAPESKIKHAILKLSQHVNMYYNSEDKYFGTSLGIIYPRSREHLESIILAFTKPE